MRARSMKSDPDRLRIAVAQLDSRWKEVEHNLERHVHFIEEARSAGVDLLIFPETSLSGYPRVSVSEGALRRQGPTVSRLAEAADGVTVLFGFVEEAPAAQMYNATAVVRDGELLHLHRKLNLATYGALEEGKHFAQGRFVETVELVPDVWRLSALICADVWNPALVHLAALHGATLLAIPTASALDAVSSEFSNPSGWSVVTRFYSMIYGMPIAMANRVGREAGLSFWGGSCIVDPFGDVLAEADRDSETLIHADLDYAQVRKARVQLPTVRDSNLGLVIREIERLDRLVGVPQMVRQRLRADVSQANEAT